MGSPRLEQMLCNMQHTVMVSGTLSTDSSSLVSKHRHRPFNKPKACSITTLAELKDLLKSI